MGAVFSQCGRYRYRLDRHIGGGGPPVTFILHNPSTADAVADDPTLRRAMGFARKWGCDRLVLVNPWARVATKPNELWITSDPVGPENDAYIDQAIGEMIQQGGFLVCAWGVIRPPKPVWPVAVKRVLSIRERLRACSADVRALGLNNDGSPKHPLYLRADATPATWALPG
ncbi:DUF1643 domain-containing protein [Methylopila capsulata]